MLNTKKNRIILGSIKIQHKLINITNEINNEVNKYTSHFINLLLLIDYVIIIMYISILEFQSLMRVTPIGD